jgi:hypothetical protein
MNILGAALIAAFAFWGTGCVTDANKPENPLGQIRLRPDPTPTIQEWADFNHYIRSISMRARIAEFKLAEKALAEKETRDDERKQAMLKYVVTSYQIEPTLPQLIKAKTYLNELMLGKRLSESEKHYWEVYSDNLNDAIRFEKLQALVTKKYEDERLARIELEEKIKELSSIEQATEERSETTKQ